MLHCYWMAQLTSDNLIYMCKSKEPTTAVSHAQHSLYIEDLPASACGVPYLTILSA